jgi:glycogen debranching enzyme
MPKPASFRAAKIGLTPLRSLHSIANPMPSLTKSPYPLARAATPLAAAILFLAVFAAVPRLRAQQPAAPQGIPRFALPASGAAWRSTAFSRKYFDVTGHRSAVLGWQNGRFEAWLYPIKVLQDFHLEFQLQGMLEPVKGDSLITQLITRPESTTLVYVDPAFTVRETIFTPAGEPAIVLLLDVDTSKPITIKALFAPDFQPMWPASFGGQYSYWVKRDKAFALTDATNLPTALVGSPAATAYTEFVGHRLASGETEFDMRVTPAEARSSLIPVVMSLGLKNLRQAESVYASVLHDIPALYDARVAAARRFLARTTSIETPDPVFNRAWLWAKLSLNAGWVCHPGLGCGLVAGYAPSGSSQRPGFDWWFGGDAQMNSWALEDYGDLAGARRALAFLERHQRADGKMMHEMTQSVDLVDWFHKYNFAYYHAETTPMYLYALDQYWRRTGNRKFLAQFWPSAKKAYGYCLTTLDPDGLMDNTKAGLAAVEVGVLRDKVVKDVYLEGFWIAGLGAMHDMATAMGDAQLAADASTRLRRAEHSIDAHWWNAKTDTLAFGLTASGRQASFDGSWPAVMLALAPHAIGAQHAFEATAAFARPDLSTDWGSRWLSNTNPLYDPLSYNNGSAWPFISGLVALAQYRHDQPLAGFATWSAIAQLTGIEKPGALPEQMTGNRYIAQARAVPHQLFSSMGVVVALVRGVLGLDADAPQGRLDFRPALPTNWPSLKFSKFAFGAHSLSGEISQSRSTLSLDLDDASAQPLAVDFAPALPWGARVMRVLVDGHPTEFHQENSTALSRVAVRFRFVRHADVAIEFTGGIAIVPAVPHPQPGDRTEQLKILRVEQKIDPSGHGEIALSVAGRGGRTYALDAYTRLSSISAEGATLEKTPSGIRLKIPFEGSGYVERTIRLRF